VLWSLGEIIFHKNGIDFLSYHSSIFHFSIYSVDLESNSLCMEKVVGTTLKDILWKIEQGQILVTFIFLRRFFSVNFLL
jgi:hypothetical protein